MVASIVSRHATTDNCGTLFVNALTLFLARKARFIDEQFLGYFKVTTHDRPIQWLCYVR
jgi:hypothetical protein